MTGAAPSSYQANVWLSYHQVQIRDANELGPQFPERWDNGLIAVADEPDGATILTGISIGPVDVTVQLTEGPPPLDLDSWEEIVEVSIESTSGITHRLRARWGPPQTAEPRLAGRGLLPASGTRTRA